VQNLLLSSFFVWSVSVIHFCEPGIELSWAELIDDGFMILISMPSSSCYTLSLSASMKFFCSDTHVWIFILCLQMD
jgi:hypothetical protein